MKLYRLLLSLTIWLFLTSCSYAPPKNSGFTDFSKYAESVFRRQNVVTTKLMMLNDSEILDNNEQVDDAEENMSSACELLNEYVERDINQESMGFTFKSKVQASIEGCDKQVKTLEQLLLPIKN